MVKGSLRKWAFWGENCKGMAERKGEDGLQECGTAVGGRELGREIGASQRHTPAILSNLQPHSGGEPWHAGRERTARP